MTDPKGKIFGKKSLRYATGPLTNLSAAITAFSACYTYVQELMSGEAAKEHVTAVLSKSKLPTYFRCVDVSAYVCGLLRNRRHLTTKKGPHISRQITRSRSLGHTAILPPLRLVTSHLAIAEHVGFCVVIPTLD